VKKIAVRLAKGDLSKVFYANGRYNMIYMLDYIPPRTKPFEEVKATIRRKIVEAKFSEARKRYLDELKAGAEIVVNDNVWTKLRKELVREDERK